MTERFSTLIVENDSLFREGLKLLLEQTEFSPITCSLECDMLETDISPSILIVFAHEKTELVATITRFRDHFAEARIVVLVAESDFEILNAAIHAGANAILLTSISAEGLIKSLKAVVTDNIFVMDARILPSAAGASTEWQITEQAAPDTAPTMRGLSQRELEILQRVVAGDSNKHIARFLDIAEATVKAHVKTILRKIGATNRTQAAIWAMQHGIEQSEPGPAPQGTLSPHQVYPAASLERPIGDGSMAGTVPAVPLVTPSGFQTAPSRPVDLSRAGAAGHVRNGAMLRPS